MKGNQRQSSRRCSVKYVLLETSQNSQKNTCARVKVAGLRSTTYTYDTYALVFSCEFCKIPNFKTHLKHIFYRTPLVAASDFSKKIILTKIVSAR